MAAAQTPVPAARVLVVDDHRQVREGIRAVLATEPTLTVVGEALFPSDVHAGFAAGAGSCTG